MRLWTKTDCPGERVLVEDVTYGVRLLETTTW